MLGVGPNELWAGNDGGPRNKRKRTKFKNTIPFLVFCFLVEKWNEPDIYGNLNSEFTIFFHKYLSGQKAPLSNM